MKKELQELLQPQALKSLQELRGNESYCEQEEQAGSDSRNLGHILI